MTIGQLKAVLMAGRFKPNAFAMDQPFTSECYCLDTVPGGWSVYYSERGNKNDLRIFGSESEACEYLLRLLRSDGTSRIG